MCLCRCCSRELIGDSMCYVWCVPLWGGGANEIVICSPSMSGLVCGGPQMETHYQNQQSCLSGPSHIQSFQGLLVDWQLMSCGLMMQPVEEREA